MKLKEYLRTENIMINKFAEKCGLTYIQMYHIIKGRKPTLLMALAIEKQTGGKVGIKDFLSPEEREEVES